MLFSLLSSLLNFGSQMATNAYNAEMNSQTNQLNYQIAKNTAITNCRIADMTNKSQERIADARNAMEIAESEKAYQRSTPSNQIAELIKTGLSEQQARQIVAGSGNPANYPAASIEAAQLQQPAPAVAPTMQPFRAQAPDFSGISNLDSFVSGQLNDPNGGLFGYMSAEDAVDFISHHSQDLPKDAKPYLSWNGWNDFAQNSPQPLWKEFLNSKAYMKMANSVFGRKYFMSYLGQLIDRNGDALRLEHQQLINYQENLKNTAQEFTNRILSSDADYNEFALEYRKLNVQAVTNRDVQQAINDLKELKLTAEAMTDESFADFFKTRFLSDNMNRALCAIADNLYNQVAIQALNPDNMSPAQQNLYNLAIFMEKCHVIGVAQELVMTGASVLAAPAEAAVGGAVKTADKVLDATADVVKEFVKRFGKSPKSRRTK